MQLHPTDRCCPTVRIEHRINISFILGVNSVETVRECGLFSNRISCHHTNQARNLRGQTQPAEQWTETSKDGYYYTVGYVRGNIAYLPTTSDNTKLTSCCCLFSLSRIAFGYSGCCLYTCTNIPDRKHMWKACLLAHSCCCCETRNEWVSFYALVFFIHSDCHRPKNTEMWWK